MKKKFLCIMLVLMMLFTSFPTLSFADNLIDVSVLLDNIAQSYIDSSSEWVIMDMAAYKDLYDNSTYNTSDTARQEYVNSAIATICNEKAKETAVAKSILGLSALGYDVTNLYPVNSNTTVSAITKLNSYVHSKSLNDQYVVLMAYAQGDYGEEANAQVDAIIEEVLKSQEDAGSWNAFNSRNDITGMIMHALSFYKDRDGVCGALERATSYLKDNVTEDGAYLYGKSTNSNTIAMVITGLVAAGVNPYLIKKTATSTDIVNGLLSFAHYNNSLYGYDGFGYTNNTSKNANATEQSFRAMVAVSHLMALNDAADLASNTDLASGTNLKACNVFDFTGITKVPARATGGKDPAVTPTDSGDSEKISVRVTIKGLYGSYILSSKKVSISKNSAVYVAFDKACKEAGINVVYRGLNYVESINGLGEFDKGPNSGWLYKVNGELPIIGIGENILTEDSEVLFYFTEDWTLDEDATAFAEPKKKVTEAAIKAPFVDIAESDWYYAAVTSAYALKMVDGVDATHFAPKSTFTRGMMVTMLYKLEGKPASTGANPFADVKSGDWYEDAIKWAYENKVVDGMDTTHFDPLADITREQMAAMLYKYAKYKKLDLSKVSNLSGYKDASSIADWALDAFKWANGNAVLNGFDGLLTPKSTATRAEAAQMLVNFVEKCK